MSKSLSQSLGITGPIYDAITSSFEMRGNGGGMSIQMFPVASTVLRETSSITKALTRESTKGQKGSALAGALGQTFGNVTGLSRHVCTQAAWNYFLGNQFKKWSMGQKDYKSYQRRRNREGYHSVPNFWEPSR